MGIEIFLGTFFVAALATFLLSRFINLIPILDRPNDRSLHKTLIPRTGGIAICLGLAFSAIFVVQIFGWRTEFSWILGAIVIIGFISFLDDCSHVPFGTRLIAHFVAAILLIISGIEIQSIKFPDMTIHLSSAIAFLLNLIVIIWMINLYNFMDGMDGFAGGMAVFGFGTLGLLGHFAGGDYYATVCWVIAASSAGFLVWNFPPARIFMGDVGSSVLGLLAAALSLWADRGGLFPLWLAVLVFAPFVFDATLTLVRRTLQGERIWEAHRSHYYQRLVQAGWSHRRTVLWEYGLMLLCSAGALCAFRASTAGQWVVIGVILGACLAGVIGVRHVERRQLASRTPEVSL